VLGELLVFDFSLLWPYITAFASLVAAGLGAPIPEELPVVGAGVWAALETTTETYGAYRFLILPVCILGVVISDVLLYTIGRKFGTRILETRFFKRLMPPARREEIEKNFHIHGIKVLLFARFLPGIRSPIFIMAGVLKLPVKRFVIADGIYAIPGVSLLFFLAWYFGDQFVELINSFEHGVSAYLKPMLILLVLLGIIAYMVWHFMKRPVSTGDPKDAPFVEQVTHVPVIKQISAIIEGKPHEKPPCEPAPTDNHQPATEPAREQPPVSGKRTGG
jgi:membrane protein DedA with SNARE-associated domain